MESDIKQQNLNILVTGGAGFIGSCVIRHLIAHSKHKVVNVDKLTYAGNLNSLKAIENNYRYSFEQVDICDASSLKFVFDNHQPDIVMHLAAESHVDRSIDSPSDFIQTNIIGTYTLLEQARFYWDALEGEKKENFKFHHISTDEVYGDLPYFDEHGSLGLEAGVGVISSQLFTEDTPYAPSSPYSASKAGSDHLVRAWQRTYGLPILLTNCSNNYGPYHFPEKLIPLIILNALEGKPLPVYGSGNQIRDWLYVEDHARALVLVAMKGIAGATYNIGGHNEMKNIDVVEAICSILDELAPSNANYSSLITHVPDRPGHDMRYAIDASKIQKELGWVPLESFETGIRKTIQWYLDNQEWCKNVQDGSYMRERLGHQL